MIRGARQWGVAMLAVGLAAGVATGWWVGRHGATSARGLAFDQGVPGQARPVALSFPTPAAAATPAVRNVILLIADGMGIAHSTAASIATFGLESGFVFQRLPVTGWIATQPEGGWVGSSDSNATAMATGHKTLNGRIGVDSAGRPLTNLLELAHAAGRPTGVVTTSQVFDATPAAFLAHSVSRYDFTAILDQTASSGVDFLAGGGLEELLPEASSGKREDGRDLLAEAERRGVAVARDLASLESAQRLPMWAIYPGKRLGEEPARPTVGDLAGKAIELLAAEARRRDTGFFLMIEEEGVDTASHVNAFDRMTAAVEHFDTAVERATRFALASGDTLVVVVADHATGGLTIDHTSEASRLRLVWTSRKHTGEPVAVYAYGPGRSAAPFTGSHDNTEVFALLAAAAGL